MVKKLLQSRLKKTLDKGKIDLDVIIEKINDGYLVGKEPKVVKKKTFAPSTLVYGHGICPRYWYLAFDGTMFEETITSKQVANMESGSKSHERIQAAIEKTGVVKQKEEKISHNNPPIFGVLDLLVEINENDVIVEIKTVDDIGFDRIRQYGKPRSYHVLQLLIYMKILDLGTGAVLYENKNTHEMMVFPITVTPEYKEFITYMFDWMREVYSAWQERKLPKRPFKTKTKVCQSCPVVNTCYQLPDGDISIKKRRDFE
jgi:CRISPR/Cas system-associated exonuclease Cas4 (RecB family)